MEKQIKKCRKCLKLLPTNEKGEVMIKGDLCPDCLRELKMNAAIDWDERKREFENIIEDIRGKHTFDGLVMLSGGKDSVYVAYLLSNIYKLNIVAITIDNGFEYDGTFENSSRLAKKLGISHMIYRLPIEVMKKYYRFFLTEESVKLKDCSQICFFCGRLLKCISIKMAKQLDVAAVFSGHTVEQVRALGDEKGKDSSYAIRQKYIQTYTERNYEKVIKILEEQNEKELIELLKDNISINRFENFIYPLQYFEYKPIEIAELLKKEVGWEADTHFTGKYISSGCKLAKIMEYVAYKNNTDTYVEREFSDQIRRGSLTVEEVQEIMNSRIEVSEERKEIMEQLSVTDDDLF